jgi:predicted Zn-dependent peptidase
VEFLSHTLANGLQIVTEYNAAAYSTAVGFFVNTGGRDEADAIAGVSHFLEHMVFKGTPTRSADDVNREFDEMGAHYNAFTNEENTVFYAAVLPEYQRQAVELLADILRPSLRDEDFETEKQVILEEIRMYEDQPPFGADEKCRALHFGPHALGRSVLGTEQSIGALPVTAMRDYFHRRYSPGNIVLAAAGQVDFDELVASAERCCGGWAALEAGRTAQPAAAIEAFQVLQKSTATQQYAILLSAGPAAEDADRFAAKILATVLGDDTGSRLYWELVDPGLAEHASLGHYEYQRAGVMMTSMSCDPEQIAENLHRLLEIYRRAEADGISATELQQAKSKVRSRIVLGGERPRGRLFVVGGDWVYRREYKTLNEDLDDVAAVTIDDVAKVLEKYPLCRATTITIGPLDQVAAPRE